MSAKLNNAGRFAHDGTGAHMNRIRLSFCVCVWMASSCGALLADDFPPIAAKIVERQNFVRETWRGVESGMARRCWYLVDRDMIPCRDAKQVGNSFRDVGGAKAVRVVRLQAFDGRLFERPTNCHPRLDRRLLGCFLRDGP
jgi:hypothetical protein